MTFEEIFQKAVNEKARLTKAPQNYCYVEVEE